MSFSKLTQNSTINILVVLCVALFVRLNIFQNQFVMDDWDFIVDWPFIRDWSNLPQFFINYTPPPGQEGIYSPLKTLFHAVNYHLFGFKPFGYHIVSLLIHSVGILFVYLISKCLSKSNTVSFYAALIFAVHPVQVEAITYMTASVDMIGIVFLFIAVYCYINSRFKFSALFSLLAIFTHELAISLPLLFLWYDFCYRRSDGFWKAFFRAFPAFCISGFYVFIKNIVLGAITRGNYVYDSFALTMFITIKAWAKYVILIFFPMTLTHNHPISRGISSFDQMDFDRFSVLSQSFLEPQVLYSTLLLIFIFVFALYKYEKQRLITFCIGWFFISLLPVSNIIPSGVYFGERYLYPGMLGFALLLGFYFHSLSEHKIFKIIGRILVILLIIIFSLRTWIRNKDWKDEITFYEAAVLANPQSALMHTDLGLVYTRFGQFDKSVEEFNKALSINATNPDIYFTFADVYIEMGEDQKALGMLKEAVELEPEFAEAYLNMAWIYEKMDNKDQALIYLEKSYDLFKKQANITNANEVGIIIEKYYK